jgi:hypothetical protein
MVPKGTFSCKHILTGIILVLEIGICKNTGASF